FAREMAPTGGERVTIERMRRDLVRGAPVPRLGFDETALRSVGTLQRDEEVETARERSAEDLVLRIAAHALERIEQERGHARLIEGRDVARALVFRTPLDRMVGIAPVLVLDRLEHADRFDRGALEIGIRLERVRAGEPRQ